MEFLGGGGAPPDQTLNGIEEPTGDQFSIAVLPDTQNYMFNGIFATQTNWIANNKTRMNIQMVLHEGDVTVNGGVSAYWTTADTAIDNLDIDGVPYLIAIGNHDYDDNLNAGGTTRLTTGFNGVFPQSRYTSQSWWNGNFYEVGKTENTYCILTIGGQVFLFVSLEFGPRNGALTWADGIIAANPTAKVIIVTHSYMYHDGTRVGTGDEHNPKDYLSDANDGEEMWTALVKKYANIILVVSGHHINGPYSSRLASTGDNNNIVNQHYLNHQEDTNGGNGWMRLLMISPSLNTIRVQTISPYLNTYKSDANNLFTCLF